MMECAPTNSPQNALEDGECGTQSYALGTAVGSANRVVKAAGDGNGSDLHRLVAMEPAVCDTSPVEAVKSNHKRVPSFLSPRMDIYINRTVISTPTGERSLEDLFLEVDADGDRRISVLHELPVALKVMGLYWTGDLASALANEAVGVHELERQLEKLAVDWWDADEDTSQRKSFDIKTPRTTTEGSPSPSSHMSSPRTPAAARKASPPATSAVPLPLPPHQLHKLQASRADGSGGADGEDRPLAPDRAIEFTTFCTIVGLLQSFGAYTDVIKQVAKAKRKYLAKGTARTAGASPPSRSGLSPKDADQLFEFPSVSSIPTLPHSAPAQHLDLMKSKTSFSSDTTDVLSLGHMTNKTSRKFGGSHLNLLTEPSSAAPRKSPIMAAAQHAWAVARRISVHSHKHRFGWGDKAPGALASARVDSDESQHNSVQRAPETSVPAPAESAAAASGPVTAYAGVAPATVVSKAEDTGTDVVDVTQLSSLSSEGQLSAITDTSSVTAANDAPAHEVFLGGACNPTTWRKTTAIPALTQAGVTYYNPQVDDWYPQLVVEEAKAKDAADVILFVISGETRGVASMIEVAELITSCRHVVLVLQDVAKDAVMNGHTLNPDEIKDLNRGRAYLANVADRHGVTTYQSLDAALAEVVSLVENKRATRAAEAPVNVQGAEAEEQGHAASAPQVAERLDIVDLSDDSNDD